MFLIKISLTFNYNLLAKKLKELVNDHIEYHVDFDTLQSTKRIEQAERESLEKFINVWN